MTWAIWSAGIGPGHVGAICNDASFGMMLAHCAILRESVLRASADCFGHRLMMDRVVPGGVTADLGGAEVARLRGLVDAVRAVMPRLTKLYDGVEAFRGDVLIWVRVRNGTIDRCHMRDASWFQWPLLEAVVEGNIIADFPSCNKSFN